MNYAEILLTDVLKKEPDNFNALLTLAMLKFQQNDFKNAGYYASRANDINPSSLEVARLKFEIGRQEGINRQNENYLILQDFMEYMYRSLLESSAILLFLNH